MTTARKLRRTATRQATKNGATETRMLTQPQVAQLRQLMQPLVAQWALSRGVVTGFLAGAGISNTQFSIDLNTGIVSLLASQSPAAPSANGTEATQSL